MKYRNKMIEYVYKYFGETIYDAVKIEISKATFASTQDILDNGPKVVSKYGERYTITVLNLKHTYEDILEVINDANWKIDAKEALRINGNVTHNLNAGSGFWRISNVRVLISREGQEDKFMTPELRKGEYYENMINSVISNNKYTSDDVISLMADMMKEQCFRDGNKRTALIFANTLLLQKNLGYIRVDNKKEYIANILDYYENKITNKQFVEKINNGFYVSAEQLEQNHELATDEEMESLNNAKESLRQDKQEEISKDVEQSNGRGR